MSDRHIRRSGDDYRDALLSLLPQGQAWPKAPGSTLERSINGLAQYWGFVDQRAADLLEIESDPRKTAELLTDWERNWGLPDPCYSAPTTVELRRIELVNRMTLLGAQSREFYKWFKQQIGFTITIREYRPFMVGMDRCGDSRVYGDGSNPMFHENFVRGYLPICNPHGERIAEGELSEWPNYGLGPPENRYYWTVNVTEAGLLWFRCSSGQCGVDPHLRIIYYEDIDCILNRWKPGHTQIVFDYSNLSPNDPMAGTP
jgi:uncharacterized protein YmfQ (DUF2313 family)